MEVFTIETPSLGDRTYLIASGESALVIDPQRDIDRVIDLAEEHGVAITHIAETHVHNDYVSGGLTLSRMTGAIYVHAAAEPLKFDYSPVSDGDTFAVGNMTVEVMHTPGHTPHHLSFVVSTDDETPPAAFTGGSMLYGTVGRTDLISPEDTDSLTRAQFQSAHALAQRLPDDARLYPTHGFGSFCASAASDEESDGTIGTERRINIALTEANEQAFVDRLIDGLDAYPRYYAHMGPINTSGGTAIDLSPPAEVDPVELARRLHRGEWVIDLRPRREFAQSHLAGSIGVELADGFSTYLGWLAPWAMPITLLADDLDDIAQAQRQLVRIGIDRPTGAATGPSGSWAPDADRRSYSVTTFSSIDAENHAPIIDVRLSGEYSSGHIDGALNIPLHEILSRLDDVPDARALVHCGSGYRASIAAALLDRAGHDVILIDDDFANATQTFTMSDG